MPEKSKHGRNVSKTSWVKLLLESDWFMSRAHSDWFSARMNENHTETNVGMLPCSDLCDSSQEAEAWCLQDQQMYNRWSQSLINKKNRISKLPFLHSVILSRLKSAHLQIVIKLHSRFHHSTSSRHFWYFSTQKKMLNSVFDQGNWSRKCPLMHFYSRNCHSTFPL